MNTALRAFYHVPVLGWLTKDAVQGASDAKYYFLLNIAVFYAFLVYLIGYPLVIVTLLLATATALTTIVVFTAIDLLDGRARAQRSAGGRRRN